MPKPLFGVRGLRVLKKVMSMSVEERTPYFVSVVRAPKILQMEGLETTILSGLRGEQMMMALNATLPGNTVPLHSHPHEQVGMVYSGKAMLKIGDEERIAQQGDFYRIPANVPHGDTCVGDEPFVMFDIFHPVREDFIVKMKMTADDEAPEKSGVTIRRAQPKEATAIHEVLKRAFKCLEGRGYSQRAIEAAILGSQAIEARIAQEGLHVLVAVIEDQIVGTASGMEEHESLRVSSMAVDPACQGHGIAHSLMDELERLARELCCHKIFLQTAWSMTEAIALYRSLGYRQEGYQPRHFYGEDFLLFGRALD
jgi:quercetin dioxygenase-like cupin family protein/ribosomal protein S18 acetylase RimI-like enzyme